MGWRPARSGRRTAAIPKAKSCSRALAERVVLCTCQPSTAKSHSGALDRVTAVFQFAPAGAYFSARYRPVVHEREALPPSENGVRTFVDAPTLTATSMPI